MKKLISILALIIAPFVSAEKVDLSWSDNSNNELGFEVERKELDGTYVTIGSVEENVSTYSDETVEAGKTYVYRVRAFNYYGYSGYTNEATNDVKLDKYFQPFEEGEDPSSLGSQQVVANLIINAQNVTVNQITKNDNIP